jgi:sugar lactone lactonase YvrE
MIGAIIPRKLGGFIAAVHEGFAVVDHNSNFDIFSHVLDSTERMNDAKCDVYGRMWAGSTDLDFKAGRGKLYRLDLDLTCETVLEGLTLPNGLGWSPDNTMFYLIDTYGLKLFVFEFDSEKGTISNQKILFDFSTIQGLPDGLCIAADGTIFVAMWGGHKILIINQDGRLVSTMELPISRPTSCSFGGANKDELLITSSSLETDSRVEPWAGMVLKIRLDDYKGTSQNFFGG